MGLFDDLFGSNDNNKKRDNNPFMPTHPYDEHRESWDYGSVSERHFGKDKYGYYNDEESMYSDDERYDRDEW